MEYLTESSDYSACGCETKILNGTTYAVVSVKVDPMFQQDKKQIRENNRRGWVGTERHRSLHSRLNLRE